MVPTRLPAFRIENHQQQFLSNGTLGQGAVPRFPKMERIKLADSVSDLNTPTFSNELHEGTYFTRCYSPVTQNSAWHICSIHVYQIEYIFKNDLL